MSDTTNAKQPEPLDRLHADAEAAVDSMEAMSRYIRGTADHLLALFNSNDWMAARRFVEGLHSRADETAKAVVGNTSSAAAAE